MKHYIYRLNSPYPIEDGFSHAVDALIQEGIRRRELTDLDVSTLCMRNRLGKELDVRKLALDTGIQIPLVINEDTGLICTEPIKRPTAPGVGTVPESAIICVIDDLLDSLTGDCIADDYLNQNKSFKKQELLSHIISITSSAYMIRDGMVDLHGGQGLAYHHVVRMQDGQELEFKDINDQHWQNRHILPLHEVFPGAFCSGARVRRGILVWEGVSGLGEELRRALTRNEVWAYLFVSLYYGLSNNCPRYLQCLNEFPKENL